MRFNAELQLADAARDEGRWGQAREHYRAALDLDGSPAAIWVQYGHALKESGDLQAACEAYQQAVERVPDCADARLQLGHALKRLGRAVSAEETYLASLRLEPRQREARRELAALGWSRVELARIAGSAGAPMAEAEVALSIAVDVSDLVQYVRHARAPTGIQRVQLEILGSLLRERRAGIHVSIVSFSEGQDGWVEVPEEMLLRMSRMAVAGGGADAPDWCALVSELQAVLAAASPAVFERGAILLNLGTSWWLPNYFLTIRRAQADYGLRYVPFVHDLIPLVLPEHCTAGLRRDFLRWLSGVFDHADGFLVNSEATRRDLLSAAEAAGREIEIEPPVRLDAAPVNRAGHRVPEEKRRPFVLFVATIESRKNHLLVFDCWLRLIRRRGAENVPDLVCVGNPGWMVEAAMARLAAVPDLSRRVHILSGVSDEGLAGLYEKCLFTLYPSLYEGWGLPVTEALSHGKVPLVARAASLPEAGGHFAEYFDPLSAADFEEKLVRLIDDEDYRRAREATIRQDHRPRRWTDVARDIVEGLKAISRREREAQVFNAEPGRFYRLGAEPAWPPRADDGERFRIGTGWWALSATGCEAGAGAALALRVPDEEARIGADYFVCLAVRGLASPTVFTLPDGEADGSIAHAAEPGRVTFVRARARLRSGNILRVEIGEPEPVAGRGEAATPIISVAGFAFFRNDDEARRRDFTERALFGELA